MKPANGRYQTTTKVKVLSHEINNVGGVDGVHMPENYTRQIVMVRSGLPSRGLRPWYGTEWKSQELGRSSQFPERILIQENLSFMGVNTHPENRVWIERNNRRERELDDWLEVGSAHSRGVTGVMSCEGDTHSKGQTLTWKGERKHNQVTEQEELCKLN